MIAGFEAGSEMAVAASTCSRYLSVVAVPTKWATEEFKHGNSSTEQTSAKTQLKVFASGSRGSLPKGTPTVAPPAPAFETRHWEDNRQTDRQTNSSHAAWIMGANQCDLWHMGNGNTDVPIPHSFFILKNKHFSGHWKSFTPSYPLAFRCLWLCSMFLIWRPEDEACFWKPR